VPIGLAAAHRAGQLDRSRVQQQFLGQRGLAGIWMGNDCESATALDFAFERGTRYYGFDLT
jgi:hypothetical protein